MMLLRDGWRKLRISAVHAMIYAMRDGSSVIGRIVKSTQSKRSI
jgi:hypothetical protein